jgi:hypothetical protein
MQKEYRKALYDLECRKPPGAVYKLFSEKGSEDGKLIYDPDDDSITIKLPGIEDIWYNTYNADSEYREFIVGILLGL